MQTVAIKDFGLNQSVVTKSLKNSEFIFIIKTMKLLSTLNIPIIDYELKEDLKGIERFLK